MILFKHLLRFQQCPTIRTTTVVATIPAETYRMIIDIKTSPAKILATQEVGSMSARTELQSETRDGSC